MRASSKYLQRLGYASITACSLIAISWALAQSSVVARSFPDDPMAVLGPYQPVWTDSAPFIFRVIFRNAGDLTTYTGDGWHYVVSYIDASSGAAPPWNQSSVVNKHSDDTKKNYWATISVTAKKRNQPSAPTKLPGGVEAKQPPKKEVHKPDRGTGTATVVITNNDRKTTYNVSGTMDLDEVP